MPQAFLRLLVVISILFWSIVTLAAPRVLLVSAEHTGIFQTGGLAHAVTGLKESFNREGISAESLIPFYSNVKMPEVDGTGRVFNVPVDWRDGHAHKNSRFELFKTKDDSKKTLFLRHDGSYFDNGAKTYAPDAHIGESFAAFGRAAADYILNENYDIVILNDWHTGLIALHLHIAKLQGRKVPKVIFAIHNLAYQGLFPKSLADFMGISSHFHMDGFEYYGQMSFIKAGLLFSDLNYTVSPRYALEITTPQFGAGLDGIMRKLESQNKLIGILNGIDDHEWDPSLNKDGLKYNFSAKDLAGKALGKAELQRDFGLPVSESVPVFILTSRMAEQKGFEYLVHSVIMAADRLNAQWIVLGDGESRYIDIFKKLEHQFPDKIRYRAFDGHLEKRLTRYADFFVNGAWFEPCGLNQMFALKNGTIPVVSEVGGLKDSVQVEKTGFTFRVIPGFNAAYDTNQTVWSAFHTFEHAVNTFRDQDRIREMRIAGMKQKNSWKYRVKADFLPLFDYLLSDEKSYLSFKDWKSLQKKPRKTSTSSAMSCKAIL